MEPLKKYKIADPVNREVFSFDKVSAAQLSSEQDFGEDDGDDGGPSEKDRPVRAKGAVPKMPARFFAPMEEVPAPGPIPATGKKAVWIVHGMGQQMPFETLDQLTNGLVDAAKRKYPNADVDPLVREAKLGDQVVQRVEVTIPATNGPVEIHLYEAYWAPLTEGVASLKEVMSFLFNGATRGLLNWARKFQRAMFGGMFDFKLTWRTGIYTSTAILVLLSLMVINAVILLSGTATMFSASVKFPMLTKHYAELSLIASIISVTAITYGVVIFLATLARPGRSRWYRTPLTVGVWIGFTITIIAIIAGAVIMALEALPNGFTVSDHPAQVQAFANLITLIAIGLAIMGMIGRGWSHSAGTTSDCNPWVSWMFYLALIVHISTLIELALLVFHLPDLSALLPFLSRHAWLSSSLWVWPFLLLISSSVRNLIVEYVGDVAIYVTPNKLDAFAAVREKIKDTAYNSAHAVFLAKAQAANELEYGKVAIVGHSLGSVIAYDTLNRLINEDVLSGSQIQIARRTSMLLTFGSPLDKIAFFFTVISKNTRHIREQLASVVQPLIQDYGYRPYPWVNVFSGNDIVCGSLDFYDKPLGRNETAPANEKRVNNVKDPDALIPLVAHVEYWTNTILWDELLANLIGAQAQQPPAAAAQHAP
jgi:hypothetical protein